MSGAKYIKPYQTVLQFLILIQELCSASMKSVGAQIVDRQSISTEWWYQHFDRNRYRDFFSETKFSETDTFFLRPYSPQPKVKLFFRYQILQNQTETFFRDQVVRNPQKIVNILETEKFQNRKVSKPKCQCLYVGSLVTILILYGARCLVLCWRSLLDFCHMAIKIFWDRLVCMMFLLLCIRIHLRRHSYFCLNIWSCSV